MSDLTSAEREQIARALGCEFHDGEYGECAACGSHAEQVWDEGLEALVDARVAAEFYTAMTKGTQITWDGETWVSFAYLRDVRDRLRGDAA